MVREALDAADGAAAVEVGVGVLVGVGPNVGAEPAVRGLARRPDLDLEVEPLLPPGHRAARGACDLLDRLGELAPAHSAPLDDAPDVSSYKSWSHQLHRPP